MLFNPKKRILKYLKGARKKGEPGLNPFVLRPFTRDVLKDIPDEWSARGPDFVGFGCGKAGTSWWYSLIRRHPQVVQNRAQHKELTYFQHFYYSGLSEEDILTYRMAFAAPEGSICGEWSPGYINNPFCADYLRKAAPDTKILILVRNPIDRGFSGINQRLQTYGKYYEFNPQQQHVYEIIDMQRLIWDSCIKGMKQILKYFDRSKILVLQYEKCKIDVNRELAKTYSFLGIDDQYKPEGIDRPVNSRVNSTRSLTSHERQRLADYFADDVYEMIKIFPEIDISLWPDF
ncbi:MAG: sulfotransferase domain-containing protein [Cyanobacteria bacterium P01_F01_bin.86]